MISALPSRTAGATLYNLGMAHARKGETDEAFRSGRLFIISGARPQRE